MLRSIEGQPDFALGQGDSDAGPSRATIFTSSYTVPSFSFTSDATSEPTARKNPDNNQVEASQSGVRLRIRRSLCPPFADESTAISD